MTDSQHVVFVGAEQSWYLNKPPHTLMVNIQHLKAPEKMGITLATVSVFVSCFVSPCSSLIFSTDVSECRRFTGRPSKQLSVSG